MMVRRSSWIRLQLVVLALPFVLMAGVIAYGSTLPARLDFSRSVTLAQPPEAVFAVLGDIDRLASWSTRVVAVERLDDEGGRATWRQTFAGRRTARLVELEREAPDRLTLAIADEAGPYRGEWVFVLEATETGCRVTLTEHARLGNAVSRFLAHFAAGKTRFAEDQLRDLARRFGEETAVEGMDGPS